MAWRRWLGPRRPGQHHALHQGRRRCDDDAVGLERHEGRRDDVWRSARGHGGPVHGRIAHSPGHAARRRRQMSLMAERPTGAFRNEEEAPPDDDSSTDTLAEPDPDAEAPAGWTATHYTAGGGLAVDE